MDIQKILKGHILWLNEKGGGKANLRGVNLRGEHLMRADLRYADLSYASLSDADLSHADLRYADLSSADLSGANLIHANLRNADLSGADLRGADLSSANLRNANLIHANLRNANLRNADLSGADLSGADLSGTNLLNANMEKACLVLAIVRNANLVGANLHNVVADARTIMYHMQCPEEGAFTGWKQCRYGVLVKLLIPEDALRSSATSRKCRCSKAIVLDIIGSESSMAISIYNPHFTYQKGETVEVENFDTERWQECSTGIHFFLTREEAKNHRM